VVESKYVVSAKLKEMGLMNEVISAGQLGEEEPMYIACSPAKESSKQIIRWIDEGTRKLRESGRLSEIMSRYGLTDWQ
jgi:polar amino acid transport system substrate-binding protein